MLSYIAEVPAQFSQLSSVVKKLKFWISPKGEIYVNNQLWEDNGQFRRTNFHNEEEFKRAFRSLKPMEMPKHIEPEFYLENVDIDMWIDARKHEDGCFMISPDDVLPRNRTELDDMILVSVTDNMTRVAQNVEWCKRISIPERRDLDIHSWGSKWQVEVEKMPHYTSASIVDTIIKGKSVHDKRVIRLVKERQSPGSFTNSDFGDFEDESKQNSFVKCLITRNVFQVYDYWTEYFCYMISLVGVSSNDIAWGFENKLMHDDFDVENQTYGQIINTTFRAFETKRSEIPSNYYSDTTCTFKFAYNVRVWYFVLLLLPSWIVAFCHAACDKDFLSLSSINTGPGMDKIYGYSGQKEIHWRPGAEHCFEIKDVVGNTNQTMEYKLKIRDAHMELDIEDYRYCGTPYVGYKVNSHCTISKFFTDCVGYNWPGADYVGTKEYIVKNTGCLAEEFRLNTNACIAYGIAQKFDYEAFKVRDSNLRIVLDLYQMNSDSSFSLVDSREWKGETTITLNTANTRITIQSPYNYQDSILKGKMLARDLNNPGVVKVINEFNEIGVHDKNKFCWSHMTVNAKYFPTEEFVRDLNLNMISARNSRGQIVSSYVSDVNIFNDAQSIKNVTGRNYYYYSDANRASNDVNIFGNPIDISPSMLRDSPTHNSMFVYEPVLITLPPNNSTSIPNGFSRFYKIYDNSIGCKLTEVTHADGVKIKFPSNGETCYTWISVWNSGLRHVITQSNGVDNSIFVEGSLINLLGIGDVFLYHDNSELRYYTYPTYSAITLNKAMNYTIKGPNYDSILFARNGGWRLARKIEQPTISVIRQLEGSFSSNIFVQSNMTIQAEVSRETVKLNTISVIGKCFNLDITTTGLTAVTITSNSSQLEDKVLDVNSNRQIELCVLNGQFNETIKFSVCSRINCDDKVVNFKSLVLNTKNLYMNAIDFIYNAGAKLSTPLQWMIDGVTNVGHRLFENVQPETILMITNSIIVIVVTIIIGALIFGFAYVTAPFRMIYNWIPKEKSTIKTEAKRVPSGKTRGNRIISFANM